MKFNFNHLMKYILIFVFIVVYSCKRDASAPQSNEGSKLFTFIDPKESGITFVNKLTEVPDEHIFNFNYLYNGAGVAIGDINNDGLQDIYFTGNRAEDKLYLNKGDFKFEDISQKSGIAAFDGWKNGVVMADVNGDGWLDIYVCRGGFKNDPKKNTNLLFINKKDGTFSEEGTRYGIGDPGFSMTASFFDFDNDNDLDLYVANRPDKFYLDIPAVMAGKKNPGLLCGDHLFRNNGDNSFSDISETAGITNNYGFGLSVTTGDLDQDGFQDIYVSNDFIENDYYYHNNGNGTFTESIKKISRHTPFYSMGTDFGDLNNDGFEEIFTVEMRPEDYKRSKTSMPVMNPKQFDTMRIVGIHEQYMHNALQLNNGNGSFSEISQYSGVDKTDWSWATLLSDFDNDGWKDIFVANGIRRDLYDRDSYGKLMYDLQHNNSKKSTEEILSNLPAAKIVNYVFQNQKNLKFKKVMNDWGIKEPSFSNGAAVADLDNDGDLDLVVNNIQDPAFVYKNNSNQNYCRLALDGPEKNKFGIGAKITLKTPEGIQYAEVRNARGYLSSSEYIVHFGLGDQKTVNEIIVKWPDGKVSDLKEPAINKVLSVKYSESENEAKDGQGSELLFVDKSDVISPAFTHKENMNFNDYKVQVLLPHRLSRLGPKLSVADVNGDGKEDFFVGGAKDQSGAIYFQTENGSFSLSKQAALIADSKYEDLGSGFFDADNDGDVDLYVVSGGTESSEGANYQDRLYLNDGKGNFTKFAKNLPTIISSGSCVSFIDFDADGDLDIFRGGRTIPDKYPFPPRSYFLKNNGKGVFEDVSNIVAKEIMQLGMITSTCVTDLNGDKIPELVLAGEWMPIKIFEIKNGVFVESALSQQLKNTEGWWYSLSNADLDGDGDQDLLCGNLGENYKFHASVEKPFQVYGNDFDHNGSIDIVLAKYNGSNLVPVRGKQCSGEQMPFINVKFPSFNAFADAKLEDIYGKGLDSSVHYSAKLFASVALMNEGGSLKLVELPGEVQFSTAQSILSADFNADQKLDLFVAGNQYGAEVETTRADASIGAFFQGNGNGSWKFIHPSSSGVFLPYDVKDAKLIHVGGTKAVLVSVNNGNLKLLQWK